MKREELENHLTTKGWTKDRWGHFKSKTGQYRMKFQAKSVRLEKQITLSGSQYSGPRNEWMRLRSQFYSKISIVDGKIHGLTF